MRAPRKGAMTTKASAAAVRSAPATSPTRRGSSCRRAPIASAALAPAGVLMVSRASAASLVLSATLVDQWLGKQPWICSIACRSTTLSLGAGLLMLDNSVTPDNRHRQFCVSPGAVSSARSLAIVEDRRPGKPETDEGADTASPRVLKLRVGMAKHGRYKIVRRVADGGMAEIFLATQLGREGFQKPVILKRIHSTIYADPQFRNMFIDEAHISMSLSHSNIVQVLDLGVAGGPLLPGAGARRRVGPGAGAAARRRGRHSRCRASSACTSPPTSAGRSPTRTASPTGRAARHRSPRRQPPQHPAVTSRVR